MAQGRRKRIHLDVNWESGTTGWIVNRNRNHYSQQNLGEIIRWFTSECWSVYSAWTRFECDRKSRQQALQEPTEVEVISENAYLSPFWGYSSLQHTELHYSHYSHVSYHPLPSFFFIYPSLYVIELKRAGGCVQGLQGALVYRDMKINWGWM